MNVLVFMPYLHDTVPGQRFRIEQWAQVLAPMGVHFQFAVFESSELRKALSRDGHPGHKIRELTRCAFHRVREVAATDEKWDVIFLHRELMLIGPPLLERAFARKGIPIVYDFDDAIFLPDVSDKNLRFKWLKWSRKTGTICRLSAHVIVGNEYLRNYALQHTDRVSVVPTTIETGRYTPKDSTAIQGRPVIGWSGSRSTIKCLKTIEGALKTLKQVRDFRLKVVGGNGFSCPGVDVESTTWSALREIDELKSFSVGVMPLPDDEWHRGKCALKALQYMAVGVPTIVSPVGVNAEIINDGVNGFIASSEEEWVEKLSLLLIDEDLRKQFAYEGRRTVEDRYSAKVHAPRVLEILERVRREKTSRSKGPQTQC